MSRGSSRPLQGDVTATTARELAHRAAAERDGTMALEAADLFVELYRAGYCLTQLAPDAGVPARPVRLRARYDGLCCNCGAPIAIDDPIFVTRGVRGVRCADCGGGQ